MTDDEIELDESELIPPPELDEFGDDVPTVVDDVIAGPVHQLCRGCGDDAMKLDDSVQPPGSHAEAWKRGCCYGNAKFYWCKGPVERRGIGQLTLIGSMEVFFFPDRRLVSRPVTDDRRRRPR